MDFLRSHHSWASKFPEEGGEQGDQKFILGWDEEDEENDSRK